MSPLQQDLPACVDALLRRRGLLDAPPLLSTDTDIDLLGEYAAIRLVVTPRHLLVLRQSVSRPT